MSGGRDDLDEAFDRLLGPLDFPMYIATTVATDDGERSGCLMGFATQSSIEPRRFLACISVENHSARVAARAEHVAVHLVPIDQIELAVLFGHETGDEVDKFAACDWTPGPGGIPLLDACPARFVGRVVDRRPVGDHTGYLLDPVLVEGHAPDRYVGFQDVADVDPGHPA